MLRKIMNIMTLMAILIVSGALTAPAQNNITRDYHDNDSYRVGDRVRVDRYLDVEVWTNHGDDEFYEGDNIVLYFRTNRDAFISIYSIDSRGRVNLLFPTNPAEDNFIRGGATYSMPGSEDDFDLVINGPEGIENIQIIASRDKFPIPDWYNHSGLVCDWDDRYDFMDYLNDTYFVRYDGQSFAYDRLALFVDEWEPDYYRPIYYPSYPAWSVCGNVYIDYPWGASVYINGIYWGCAPLYVPRLLVGWHTLSIYDPYGYLWEHDFHVSRYNTVVFDRTVIKTKQHVVSRFKDIGYRNPVTHGYPTFKKNVIASNKGAVTTKNNVIVKNNVTVNKTTNVKATKTFNKNYVRGSSKLIKTEKGYETDNIYTKSSKSAKKSGAYKSTSKSSKSSSQSSSNSSRSYKSSSSKSSGTANSYKSGTSKSTKDYYRKKSGTVQKQNSSKSSSSSSRISKSSRSSSKSSKASKSSGSYKSGATKSSKSSSSTVTKQAAPSKSSGSTSKTAKSGGSNSKEKKK